MFNSLTKAYLWVMICMAFSVGITSVEAKRRDAAIQRATEQALVRGLWSGCAELTNPTRRQVFAVIAQLEAHQALSREGGPPYGHSYYDDLREIAAPIDCEAYARHRVGYYDPSD